MALSRGDRGFSVAKSSKCRSSMRGDGDPFGTRSLLFTFLLVVLRGEAVLGKVRSEKVDLSQAGEIKLGKVDLQ